MGFPWDPGGGLHPKPKGEVKSSPYGEFVTLAEPSPNPPGDPSQASREVRTGNAMRANSGQVRTLLQGRVRAIGDRRTPPQRRALLVCSRVSAQIGSLHRAKALAAQVPFSPHLQVKRSAASPFVERFLSPVAKREYDHSQISENGDDTVSSLASDKAAERLHARAASIEARLSGVPNPFPSPQELLGGAADLHRGLATMLGPLDPTRQRDGKHPNPNSKPDPARDPSLHVSGKERSETREGDAGLGGQVNQEGGDCPQRANLNDLPIEKDRPKNRSTPSPQSLDPTNGNDGLTPPTAPSVKDPKPKRERIVRLAIPHPNDPRSLLGVVRPGGSSPLDNADDDCSVPPSVSESQALRVDGGNPRVTSPSKAEQGGLECLLPLIGGLDSTNPRVAPRQTSENLDPKDPDPNPSNRADHSRPSDPANVRVRVQELLRAIRKSHSIGAVKEALANSLPSFTVFELHTGGCLDTIAAILSGFRHLGGTEDVSSTLGRLKAGFFEDLTHERCLGDTRDWEKWISCITREIDYLKSGSPCQDYTPTGSGLGSGGNRGGDLFIEQIAPILALRPKVIRLEMVPSALETNDGAEVKLVEDTLGVDYKIYTKTLDCWRHGDPSTRSRLFIIGLRRDHFSGVEWSWPENIFGTDAYPIARDIAVPDDEVPLTYQRRESIPYVFKQLRQEEPGRILPIGFAGDPLKPNDIGPSKNPNSVQSWDAGLAVQLASNGGSRRPSLDWKPGTPIDYTRLTCPVETLRAASLDEASYEAIARKHYRRSSGMNFDGWLRELVNLGVPVSTGMAIDLSVQDVLKQARTPPTDHCAELAQCRAFNAHDSDTHDNDDGLAYPSDFGSALISKGVRLGSESNGMTYGIGDSGATHHLHDSEFNPYMYNTQRSKSEYCTAGDEMIQGDLTGSMDISVLNLDHQPEAPISVDHTIQTTTVKGLGSNLFSLEDEFERNGYDIYLRHGYKDGDFTGMYRPPEASSFGPESFIPMCYDLEGTGGWRVPYLIRKPGTSDSDHKALLEAVLSQNRANCSRGARIALKQHEYTTEQASQLEKILWACPSVAQQTTVRVEGERNIRPAFTYGGLKRYKRKGWHEFHTAMAHMGEPGQPCAVCDMFKGCAIPKPKHTEGRPRESRPGHTWHMDMITFRHRSEEGCKYLIVITDETTGTFQLIPLHWKSDATFELERWIVALRAHPAFRETEYGIISRIITDNDSVWGDDTEVFQEMIVRVKGVEVIYGPPEDHARANARAEGSNKIIEAGIQSLLYEQNLPPSWWQRAANDVMFLANRFPKYSAAAAMPPDGDVAPPIEQLFTVRGVAYISRNQVYRELDSYVSVGTPALCHMPKVKGSDLEPKVRWGIAIGQRGKVTRWMCPFTRVQFRRRAFTAFTLKTGINWSQFLGLGDIAPSAQSRIFHRGEDDVEPTVRVLELPAVKPAQVLLPPPVKEITESLEDGTIHHAISGSNGDDGSELCEFFPRITRSSHITDKDLAEGVKDMTTPEGETGVSPEDEADEPTEVHPPHDEVADATTPAVIVLNSKGERMETGPSSFPVGSSHDADGDNLYVEGCEDQLDCEATHSPVEPRLTRKATDALNKDSDLQPESYQGKDTSGLLEEDSLMGASKTPTVKGTKTTPKGKSKKPKRPPDDSLTTSEPVTKRAKKPHPSITPVMPEFRIDIPSGDIEGLSEADREDLEADAVRELTYVTDGDTNWPRVCKLMNSHHNRLPIAHYDLYRVWLLTKPIRTGESEICIEDLPANVCNFRYPLKEGLSLPYPAGPHWDNLLKDLAYRSKHGDRVSLEESSEEQAYSAMQWYTHDLHSDITGLALLCRAALAQQTTLSEMQSYLDVILKTDIEELGLSAYAARKIRRRSTAVIGSGEEPPPKTIVEALMGERAEEWVESIYSEFNGLEDQGVFSHNWTLQDLKDAGIRGKPIPCSIALTHKYKDGILTRLKTRICIAGHRGNVTKGIHYHEVFSPSPVQHTERLLQAMMVNLHLHNLAWDIKMAYTWAPLPEGERVAVIYPEGFKRPDKEGHEVFMVLERNLYGMPSAGRGWGKHRDAFILKRFNESGWSCIQCTHDPCLFVIDRFMGDKPNPPPPVIPDSGQELPPHAARSWVLIHTDDCDAYGTHLDVLNEINDAMDTEWKTELVDRSYILGVKRELTQAPSGWYVTLTMTSFIEDMASIYESHLDRMFGKRRVRTPFPEGLILTKAQVPREGEIDRNITRGYQRLVGSLLWCVRHVCPVASYGMSQLCKLMSCPTDEAWDAAIHLLKYVLQEKNRGIRFTETNEEPLAFVDASNKDDPFDGKTQYGYAIFWGGPLIVKSSKLSHVGINSTYNEYMGLHHCNKQVVWLRQLMAEIGLSDWIREPTRVFADNTQANKLCNEDLVTAGNMYFRTGYHYNKEAVRDGYTSIHYCSTELNVADVTTKGLGNIKLETFEAQLHGFKPLQQLQ
jgi:hypothetical protein